MRKAKGPQSRYEAFTVGDLRKGLIAIAAWTDAVRDVMTAPEVCCTVLGSFGPPTKGDGGHWPPVAEHEACRVRAPIKTGTVSAGDVAEVLAVLRDCTGSITKVLGRLPASMEVRRPTVRSVRPKPKPEPRQKAKSRPRATVKATGKTKPRGRTK